MQPARMHLLRANAVRLRRRLRESEAAFIGLAAIVGLAAGLATNLIGLVAHLIQHLFYGVEVNRLSAIGSIHHPWKLLTLPLGGLLMVAGSHYLRRRSTGQIDVVEANALHGGRIPWIDNLIVSDRRSSRTASAPRSGSRRPTPRRAAGSLGCWASGSRYAATTCACSLGPARARASAQRSARRWRARSMLSRSSSAPTRRRQ